jgi:TonB-linked SusC/RagA family outer membrane protein
MNKTLLPTFFLLGLALLFVQLPDAVGQTISGKVTSVNGALPGVNVLVKGTSTGVITDAVGHYTIQASSDNVLVFSFIGYLTKEVPVGNVTKLDVVLEEDIKNLGEVVVTAFGVKQERKALSYSVQEVKAKDIVESQQPNIVNALQGKVAGVQITNSGGAPGASSLILIRGGTSLSGNNQPLFVVDGIPIDNTTNVTQGTNLTAQSAPASNRGIDLNPEEIESISVLKGPAAAALYGLRAASGVVVITTKKGTSGKPRISYSNSFSFDEANKLPEQQSTYKQGDKGVFKPEAVTSWGPAFVSGEPIYDNFKDFFQTGFSQKHDLSVSGGTDKSTFFASASHFDQKGIVKNTNFTRNSFRLAAETKIGEKLRVSGSANYIKTDRDYVLQGQGLAETSSAETARAGGVIAAALAWPRNDDMRTYLNSDGTQRTIIGNDNPYWSVKNNPLSNDVNRLLTVGSVVYDPFKFLNITYRLGTDYFTDNFSSLRSPGTRIAAESRGAISQATLNKQITTSTLLVTGKTTFARHFNVSLTLGHNAESAKGKSTTWYGRNFIAANITSVNNVEQKDRTVSEAASMRRIVGVFGDFSLDWKKIAFLNVRGRNDWSSTLPVKDRSFFYPAVGVSVLITDLLSEMGISRGSNQVLSFGKVRATWARVGKDAPPHILSTTLSAATNTITIAPRGYISNVGSFFGNPALKPEFTNSIEVGAEVRFLDNRIGLDASYYNMTSDNQILVTRTPPSSSTFLAYLNGGSISNKGFELILNAGVIRNAAFSWTVDLNWSTSKSVVKSLPGSLDRVELSDASSVNAVAQGAAFLNGSLFAINGNVWERNAAGQLLLNKNGYPQTAALLSNIGDRNPDWIGGITNTFTYKGLSLSFLWDVRKGGQVYNATENFLVQTGQSNKTLNRGQSIIFDGIIETTGEVNTKSVVLDQAYYQSIYVRNGYDFVEDGSWLRLRYATLNYTLPVKVVEKTPLSNVQVFVTGRNLLLFTPYSGMDPEVTSGGAGVGGGGSFGMDNMGVPATRGIDMGLKISL